MSANSTQQRPQVVENPNSVELIMPATIEELQGIVAGLVTVVKHLTTNVTQVTQTVGNMAETGSCTR